MASIHTLTQVGFQESKLTQRSELFQLLKKDLSSKVLTNSDLEKVCRQLPKTLFVYYDSKSRSFARDALSALLKYYPQVREPLIKCLASTLQCLNNTYATKNIADLAVEAFRWTMIIALTFEKEKEFSKTLITLQATLLNIIVSSSVPRFERTANRQFQLIFRKPYLVDSYFAELSQKEASTQNLVFWSFLVKILKEKKVNNLLEDHKATILDHFIKIIFSTKVRIPSFLVKYTKPILKTLSHEEFKKLIFPAIQKALLRSPELAMESTSYILEGVSLDLSQYAQEFGQLLSNHICSKDEQCQSEALETCKHLAQQCSNTEAIENLIDIFFDVLNGSKGKLTIATQRIGVLTAIGNLSYNIVGMNSAEKQSSLVAQRLFPFLKQETSEAILIHALKQLSLWCNKFVNEVPELLIEGFQHGLSLKSSNSNVRTAYFQCIYMAFHRHRGSNIQKLIPYLEKAVDASFMTYTHTPVVNEAVYAACCLLNQEYPPEIVLKVISDAKGNTIFSERYLSSASEENLVFALTLIEKLLLDYYEAVKPQDLYKALVQLVLHSKYHVRKQAQLTTQRLTTAIGQEFVEHMLQEFTIHFDKPIVQEKDSEPVSTKPLEDALKVLCSCPNFQETERIKTAFQAFLLSHSPSIGSWKRCHTTFLSILSKLKLDSSFFKKNTMKLKLMVLECGGALDIARQNCIYTLINEEPKAFVELFTAIAIERLNEPKFLEVSLQDYYIFKTPDGELYNKSVIESLAANNKPTNIKRESKLYSFKEQMEEIELRKELEAKKKSKNVNKEPELSKKQLEMKAAQLEKEAQTRSKVQKLESELLKYISLLNAIYDRGCSTGDAIELNLNRSKYLPQIIESLIYLFPSPFCAEKAVEVFVGLQDHIVRGQFIGEKLAFLTVKVLQPACNADEHWVFSNVILDSVELLNKIAKLDNFNSPLFAYSFPLIRWILLNNTSSYDSLMDCLKIVDTHTTPALYSQAEPELLINASFLPFNAIIKMLLIVIDSSTAIPIKNISKKILANLLNVLNHFEDSDLFAEIKVLLEALKSANPEVRSMALISLEIFKDRFPTFSDSYDELLLCRLWVEMFDDNEENRQKAQSLWDLADLQPNESLCLNVLEDVVSMKDNIRAAASDALTRCLELFPSQTSLVIGQLLCLYREKLDLPPPLLDDFGRVITEAPVDIWEPRSGIALALEKLGDKLDQELVLDLMSFFIKDGLADRNEKVRTQIINAAVAIINLHGKDNINRLLPMFESYLLETSDHSEYDAVRQGLVILMGTLAHHLQPGDEKIRPIIEQLMNTLMTPSQLVQEAVAKCLPKLLELVKEDAEEYFEKILHLLLESQKYGERRGAAYGLAGFVKGLGILCLKQYKIMNSLVEALLDKKEYRHREGALLALEILCTELGRLFEPYIVHVLPNMLLCFGDPHKDVRSATDDTAKAMMSKLSAHGVKLVLPSLVTALKEDSWRTKAGSVELLGAMAYCAPKQLSSCLPNIVPRLIEVLSDSHMKVQKAGGQALKLIGSVIKNPEIQAIVPTLLDALQNPGQKTSACLTELLNTKFVHFIDAPSLALIMPVVHRAFLDRSTETRKMAAQIIGNMYSLTDQKDLVPYMPTIIPGLKQSLLDPVPEVRSVSARALGAMVKGMGEKTFEDLLPWLMATLTSELSPVDRSGAAQGLSEILGGLGMEKLNDILPEIINRSERNDVPPHIKDGYIMMFIYLPMVFQNDFLPFIGLIINPILKALADETEYVRDTALKAGQRIVNMYAETAITLLLPELEKGLFDESWRIRLSSIQLLGDLLYKISGVSGKMSTESADDDDNFGTEQSQKAILRVLGVQRHHMVLSGLYMGRSDVALMVRQTALHVWKVIVSNTPRTLREILPTLFTVLLGSLASNCNDKKQIAARTLGDLVKKLGERVLPEIIPILENGLDSEDCNQRQGVCIGLSEIMASTSKEMVMTFVDSLVPTVRRALADDLPEVRQAAAKTFDSLHSTVGVRALEEILPPLLRQLSNPDKAENTLDGLKQVMAIKSRVVLPYLVPQLTSKPANTKALAMLSSVAGDALSKHLNRILPALLDSLASSFDTPNQQQELEYCHAVIMAGAGDQGIRTIIDSLLESTRGDNPTRKRAAAKLLSKFCCETKADVSIYITQLFRGLIHLFTDKDPDVLQSSWDALNAITKSLDVENQAHYISDVRQAIRFAAMDLKDEEYLPGFCLPKGAAPLIPIFREAILQGSTDVKEQAAMGLKEVISLTCPESLRPSVINITGPLIRILGDRYTWSVKVAVLDIMIMLLNKVAVILKPFLPQLQATCLKALSDPNRAVRIRTAQTVGLLTSIHPKPDTLFQELFLNAKTIEDPQSKETVLFALRLLTSKGGHKMPSQIKINLVPLLDNMLSHPDPIRSVAAACLATLGMWITDEEIPNFMSQYMLDEDPSQEWIYRHGKCTVLMVALKELPQRILVPELEEKVVKSLGQYLNSDRLHITLTGIRATGYFFKHYIESGKSGTPPMLQTFIRLMNHSSNEVKQVVSLAVSYLGKTTVLPNSFLKAVVPQLVNGTKEKNSIVKANSELALVAVLNLRTDEETSQRCLNLLEAGAREALLDVIQKVLKKLANLVATKEEDLDSTILF